MMMSSKMFFLMQLNHNKIAISIENVSSWQRSLLENSILIGSRFMQIQETVANVLTALGRPVEQAHPGINEKTCAKRLKRSFEYQVLPKVLLVGSSTGGPKALNTLLRAMPNNIGVPVVIAQHMPATFTKSLAKQLNQHTALTVKEAQDGEILREGHVYIAPGDRHLLLKRDNPRVVRLQINDKDPVNFCRPSVDLLFESAAIGYGSRCIAVVLTGMGTDGLAGCASLSERGASIIVQDEASSVVWGMPGNIVGAGLADHVLGIEELGGVLASMLIGDQAA